MTGSLQVKKGMYYVVARLPDRNGVMKQKWISTGISAEKGNKRKANAKVQDILKEIEEKKIIYDENILFVDWLHKWLDSKSNEIRQNSWEAYSGYITNHIEPFFKPLKLTLRTLTPQHIQDYYDFKLRTKSNPKGLSNNSIHRHHAVIHGALKDAMWKNMIPYNPADRVKLPPRTSYESKAYTAEQAQLLVSKLEEEPMRSLVVLGLYYGLRRSEVLGLRWQDIDFNAGTMKIRNTIVRTNQLIEHEETKSRASKRTLILVPETVPYLKALKKSQIENRLRLGEKYGVTDHVCVWPDGRIPKPGYVSRAFGRFLKRNGLPQIRFHELRHTAGSLLMNDGRNVKQIQEYLGHEKAATTLDIYGHLTLEKREESARVMGELIAPVKAAF